VKLLIVEDEPRLRDCIAHNIPWEDHGIEVIGLARNGLEALEIMRRIPPDLLLLDIQMPKMDGLELAEKAAEMFPGIQMVVLSGFNQFDYAQRAMQLGIDRYLLKPAEDKEILEAVLKAAEQVRRELERKHSQQDLVQRWNDHLPILREHFLQNWILGSISPQEMKRWSRYLGADLLSREHYAVVVAEMDPIPETETRFSREDDSLLQFSLRCIAKEVLEDASCQVFGDASGRTVILHYALEGESVHALTGRANGSAMQLLTVVKECMKLTASAGIGQAVSPDHVSLSYKQALSALRDRILYGRDIAITHHAHEPDEKVYAADTEDLAKQLEIALISGDAERSSEVVREMFDAVMEPANSAEAVQEELLALNSMLIRIVREQGMTLRRVAGPDMVFFRNIEALRTKDQILEWLDSSVRKIAGSFAQAKVRGRHHLVVGAQNIIQEKLDEPITLYAVAQMLYTTPTYLSRLFKVEVGRSFSDYVLMEKMERAKQLLLSGCKVYDAARSIGFRDVSYFTKVFRKYWGVTPGEIRNN